MSICGIPAMMEQKTKRQKGVSPNKIWEGEREKVLADERTSGEDRLSNERRIMVQLPHRPKVTVKYAFLIFKQSRLWINTF